MTGHELKDALERMSDAELDATVYCNLGYGESPESVQYEPPENWRSPRIYLQD